MKNIPWLVAGFVLGVVVTLAVQYACLRFRVPFRILPPTAVIAPRSISLDAGKMILTQTKDGAAVINFTSYGDFGSESIYRWRFRSRTGAETHGTGRVKDHDGKCSPISAGGVKVLWSWGSKTNCWLYYFDQDVTVHVLPDKTFDIEQLR
jgi:hypothetical protein